MKIIITLALLFILSSCGRNSRQENLNFSSVSQSLIDINIQNSSADFQWTREYSDTIIEEVNSNVKLSALLESDINPSDLKRLKCLNFNSLSNYEKSIFYTVYLAAIAEAESDFQPKSVTGTNIGLLQIDRKSAYNHAKNEYGELSELDLKNPIVNLKVGLFILKNQITSRVAKNRFLPTDIYYWEVLEKNKRFFKNFKNNYSNLEFCQRE